MEVQVKAEVKDGGEAGPEVTCFEAEVSENNSVGEDKASSSASSSTSGTKGVESEPAAAVLSKKALKRLAKQAKWEEHKKLKRLKTRAKRKERNQRVAGTELSRKALKLKTLANSKSRVGIVIDLSFDEHMIEKDVCKTVKQVHRCYSFNRRQPEPLQLHVTSFNGESAKVMERHDGFDNWDLLFHTEAYDEIFDKSFIVYLTSDSNNVIQNVEEDKFYIIGGLVDHNSKKGICYDLAVKKGISHARLPIDEFLDMKTRKVLAINHVFEIMANVYKGMSWQEALIFVIPSRKQADLKPITTEAPNSLQPYESDDDVEEPSQELINCSNQFTELPPGEFVESNYESDYHSEWELDLDGRSDKDDEQLSQSLAKPNECPDKCDESSQPKPGVGSDEREAPTKE